MINPITREVTQIELSIDGVVSYVDDDVWRDYIELNLPYIVTIPNENRRVYDPVSGKYGYDFVDITDWIVSNLSGTWFNNMHKYRFSDQKDATIFRLFWDSTGPDYSINAPIRHRI